MEKEIKKELKEIRQKIPTKLFLELIQELYFQTSWEWVKELIEDKRINPDTIFEIQLKISRITGIQGGNSLKPFIFTGNPLERIVKQFIFAAMNMGVATKFEFESENECKIIFKKNCGHGIKIKQYNLPFTCNDWCEVHFNAEFSVLNADYGIKLIEGLPQGKKYCKFLIYKK